MAQKISKQLVAFHNSFRAETLWHLRTLSLLIPTKSCSFVCNMRPVWELVFLIR